MDRTKLRISEDEDAKSARIKALEDMVKLGQIEEATFQNLRDEIVGGTVQDTHLVKGLDRKLLQKVKAGVDVHAEPLGTTDKAAQTKDAEAKDTDLEEELEHYNAGAIAPLAKGKKVKQGTMAGSKRKRDDILKELRAARCMKTADTHIQHPALGARFKKIGEKRDQSRIERDEKGRDVLILVDADGNVKRKVKPVQSPEAEAIKKHLPVPDKAIAPLGIEVSLSAQATPSPIGNLDIFDDVGNDFDPLGQGVESSGDDSADEPLEESQANSEQKASSEKPNDHLDPFNQQSRRRDYFYDLQSTKDASTSVPNPLADPTILSALKRASKIQSTATEPPEDAEEAAKLLRRKRLLEAHDRDAEDMDLGFGSSRKGDDEEGEDAKHVKLSIWGQEGEQGRERGHGQKEKRKRGPKNKKGDKNSVADVMKVLERRKGI